MLKYCVEQWDKNKGKLEADIRANIQAYSDESYEYLVKQVAEIILSDENGNEYNSSKITEIDNGDYQGTLLYMIPRKTYQPSADEYLMTHVSYGSCSGCDTLQSIQMDYDLERDLDQIVKEYMQLCLHLVQNVIKPYNGGWRNDERFEHVEQ